MTIMKPFARSLSSLPPLILPLCALCAALPAWSQTAPVTATAAELAKYDVN
jgi:hypothetical protein